jgi:hypothetical protein
MVTILRWEPPCMISGLIWRILDAPHLALSYVLRRCVVRLCLGRGSLHGIPHLSPLGTSSIEPPQDVDAEWRRQQATNGHSFLV